LAQEVLLKRADTALYRAKARGRNRCELFDQAMTVGTAARAVLEAELAQACESNQLLLLYQPQIDLHSGALLGFEALPRWQHPRRGLIGPEVFLPAAEQADLIGSVGLWILQRACRDAAQWQMADGAALRVAINIGQRQLQQETLPGQVQRVLSETGLRPEQLELELNETALLEEQGPSVQVMARLRALGIGLALDDFGTGYASLNHLRRYPVHRVKIHRSLIRDLARGGSDAALVRHLVGLAQELGLRVMAEGIETSEQLAVLRKLGCHEGQGLLLGHPMLAGEVPSLLVEAA
jgi:EAL domain-containing protein (putative c-di-GMP-specific phosphodiesterase class I)